MRAFKSVGGTPLFMTQGEGPTLIEAITYRLGKDQIFAMREQAARLQGEKFSLKTFHLAFIKQGTIPSGYFRESLLHELTPAAR